VYEERETLRLLGLLEQREERDPDVEFVRRLDMEREADVVEEACAGWDDWRGFPLPGFESPRYLNEREREYRRWYRGSSPEAARARRIRDGM
jgi:hypothetical protein